MLQRQLLKSEINYRWILIRQKMNIFLVRLEKLERPEKIEAATKIYLTPF
jgi:hypothetical protein